MAAVDVVCAGSVVADLFCDAIDRLPAAGTLQQIDDILLAGGGSAINVAVNLSRLGLRVRVEGKVGRDVFGDFIRDYLTERKIDVSSLHRSSTAPTAKTVIINIHGEDRRYLTCFGAAAELSAGDVQAVSLEGARLLYVGSYLALPLLKQADLAHLLGVAKGMGLMTALDVVIPSARPCSLVDCELVLPLTDLFFPNLDEARRLTGLAEPVEQAQALGKLNPRGSVVVTCGPAGAVAVGPEGLASVGRYPMLIVDPAGAGDAFSAGFLAASLEGWPLEQKLAFASALGASAVRKKGCNSGVFNRREAMEYLSASQSEPFLLKG